MDPIATVALTYPVKLEDQDGDVREEIDTLEWHRRPTAGDLLKAEKQSKGSEVGFTIALTALLTKQPSAIIKRLDGADYVRVSEVTQGFLLDSPATGQAD